MDDLSPTARAALRRYHAAAGLEEPARERVWQAIEGSIAQEPIPLRRRGRVAAGVAVIVALAATVVFAVCDVRGRLGESRRAEVDAAAFEAKAKAERAARLVAPAASAGAKREAVVEDVVVPRPQRRGGTRPTETATVERGLAAEMEWLRAARAAIDGGDAEAALRALDGHAREFVAGQMLEDRKRLRIEALCLLGRGDEARAEIAAFLREHPGSTYTGRVRGLCPAPEF
jgi:hypothetical protein